MKKTELKNGMIVQTTHNRFGVVEIEKNRIDFCYDPDCIDDNDKVLEKVSLDDILEFGNEQMGVGCTLTKELKEKYPNLFDMKNIGEIIIWYEIVAIYETKKIYDNGEGIYPPIVFE